jgi:ABC-type phosphate/phosphonate transport system substrate-binding protein
VKSYQFYTTLAASGLCLALSIAGVFMGQSNQAAQLQAQQQQEEINKGVTAQQVGTNILRDVAPLSLKNEQLKNLLAKHGYTVNANPAPSPAAAASPTSATPPASQQ